MREGKKQSGDRKQEIVQAAKELFMTQGYEKTTVESIINAMGVSKGMFYHHYKSKEAVLEDVLDLVAATVTEETVAIMSAKNRNAKEKLQELFRYKHTYIYQMERESINKLFWLEFYANISKKCYEIIKPYITKLIFDGVKEGCFHVKNAKFTAFVFASMFISVESLKNEYDELFGDIEESFEAGKELAGRILGCDFNEPGN